MVLTLGSLDRYYPILNGSELGRLIQSLFTTQINRNSRRRSLGMWVLISPLAKVQEPPEGRLWWRNVSAPYFLLKNRSTRRSPPSSMGTWFWKELTQILGQNLGWAILRMDNLAGPCDTPPANPSQFYKCILKALHVTWQYEINKSATSPFSWSIWPTGPPCLV